MESQETQNLAVYNEMIFCARRYILTWKSKGIDNF